MQRFDDGAELRIQIGEVPGIDEIELIDKLTSGLLRCSADLFIAHAVDFGGIGIWIEKALREQAV